MLRARTTFTGTTGAPWLSTMYFIAATENQAAADAVIAAVGAFWGAVDARLGTAIQWTTDPSVAVLDLDGTQTGAFATTPQVGTGASATELMPPANQILLRLRTNLFVGGREIRGRIFVPGNTEADATAGLVASAAQTAVNVAAAALIADANTIWAVWSPTNATATAVVSATAWSQWAVLRSRRD